MVQKIVTEQGEATVSYKDTLNLPKTDFPIRAQAAVDDARMLERWKSDDLYAAAFTHNIGNEKFVLHDGPPYANGHIHLGHAYNKILKDIVAKSERMAGKHVPVTPGWDCHGLPIEFKVAGDNPGVSREELQKKCRVYAQTWIDAQKEEFKKLGILMDWDHPYITMNPQQEADTVRAFGHAIEDGYISRKNKTVPWCATCQTVLAAAEIEYEDRKDPSLYVKFALSADDAQRIFKTDKKVSLVMWTTTPWTIALNRALFLKPEASYDLLDINGDLIVVGSALADSVCTALQVSKNVIATCKAEDLVGAHAHHPFVENLQVPVLADQFVGLTDGTAVVHCAPGCGPEDYEMGLRYNLEIFSPVAPDGSYTKGIMPVELEGMNIKDALSWVITTLQNNNALLYKSSIKHSFPHCWRCRNGLIFRATKQWFCELSKHNLRERALAALEKVTFIPHATRNHLKSAVSGRLEWCLSRQRAWGTPIIAVVCTGCDKEYTSLEMIGYVAKKIQSGGIEAWNNVQISELIAADFACMACGSKHFRKEQDILDVWFDSGVTHQTVLKKNKALGFPADLYLEGVDQHRGWFQSSLLTSMMYGDVAPFKMVATHGFTVDEKGRKMSKSLNNGVEPQQLVDRLGTDGLRLWASSINMEGDAVVSEKVLSNVQEVFRKIRNTCRGLLMNLYDFDTVKDTVALSDMGIIDRQALHQLSVLNAQVLQAYQEKDSTRVFHMITDYCAVQVSSLYLDIAKDRLYTDQADGMPRRSAQTVCWYMLDALTKLIAPVMSFTAEQLSDYYQNNKTTSIHLQNFAATHFLWRDQYVQLGNQQDEAIAYENKKHEQWEALAGMRSVVLKAIEMLRQKSVIKHSLEAKVTITMDMTKTENTLIKGLLSEAGVKGQSVSQMLKEYCIISACDIVETENTDDWSDTIETEDDEYEEQDFDDSVTYVDGGLGMQVKVEHAQGVKCPRCWQWEVTDHKDGLCTRCQRVVQRQSN